jgi:hypothetical protein
MASATRADRRARTPARWGHWVLVALVLAAQAAALLVHQQLAGGRAPADTGAIAAPSGPGLALARDEPGAVRGQPGTVSLTHGERLRYLWTTPFQQVFYRQLMYLVVIHSMATALTGVRLRWHKLARIGDGA